VGLYGFFSLIAATRSLKLLVFAFESKSLYHCRIGRFGCVAKRLTQQVSINGEEK